MYWLMSGLDGVDIGIGGILFYVGKTLIDLLVDAVKRRIQFSYEKRLAAHQNHHETGRQLVMERIRLYKDFDRDVNNLVVAYNQGYGHPGLLHQVRDQIGEIQRHAPAAVVTAAEAMRAAIAKMLSAKGADESAYPEFTRAYAEFRDACRIDQGLDEYPATKADSEEDARARAAGERRQLPREAGHRYFTSQ